MRLQHQTRKNVQAAGISLLLYRLAINHRTMHRTWSQLKIEHSAQKLARQIMVSLAAIVVVERVLSGIHA